MPPPQKEAKQWLKLTHAPQEIQRWAYGSLLGIGAIEDRFPRGSGDGEPQVRGCDRNVLKAR